jgi:hypothetical protein
MFIFVVYDVYVMLLASTDNLQCVCVLVACSVQELRRMPGQGFLAWQSMTSATGNGVKRTGKDWQTACKHPFAIVSICYCKFCCNPYTHAIQKQVEIRQSQSFILAVYDRLSPKYLLPAMNPNHGERGNSRYNQRAFCCRHLLAHCSWAHTFLNALPSASILPMSFQVVSNLLSAPGLQVMVSQNGKISRFMAEPRAWTSWAVCSCNGICHPWQSWTHMNTRSCESNPGDIEMWWCFTKTLIVIPWSCVKELWWKRLVVRRQAICSCPWKMISRNFHQNWCFSGW